MKEQSIKNILKVLLENLLKTKNAQLATDIDNLATLIKSQENIRPSEELDEILDDLLSLHHYGEESDFSIRDKEIRAIYNNL